MDLPVIRIVMLNIHLSGFVINSEIRLELLRISPKYYVMYCVVNKIVNSNDTNYKSQLKVVIRE